MAEGDSVQTNARDLSHYTGLAGILYGKVAEGHNGVLEVSIKGVVGQHSSYLATRNSLMELAALARPVVGDLYERVLKKWSKLQEAYAAKVKEDIGALEGTLRENPITAESLTEVRREYDALEAGSNVGTFREKAEKHSRLSKLADKLGEIEKYQTQLTILERASVDLQRIIDCSGTDNIHYKLPSIDEIQTQSESGKYSPPAFEPFRILIPDPEISDIFSSDREELGLPVLTASELSSRLTLSNLPKTLEDFLRLKKWVDQYIAGKVFTSKDVFDEMKKDDKRYSLSQKTIGGYLEREANLFNVKRRTDIGQGYLFEKLSQVQKEDVVFINQLVGKLQRSEKAVVDTHYLTLGLLRMRDISGSYDGFTSELLSRAIMDGYGYQLIPRSISKYIGDGVKFRISIDKTDPRFSKYFFKTVEPTETQSRLVNTAFDDLAFGPVTAQSLVEHAQKAEQYVLHQKVADHLLVSISKSRGHKKTSDNPLTYQKTERPPAARASAKNIKGGPRGRM